MKEKTLREHLKGAIKKRWDNTDEEGRKAVGKQLKEAREKKKFSTGELGVHVQE